MDSLKYRNPFASRLCGILMLSLLGGARLHAEETAGSLPEHSSDPYSSWDSTLTPAAGRPFPVISPFKAEYRFGWEGVSAGGASVKVGVGPSGCRTMEAQGGPDFWIRKLWDYQAFYVGAAGPHGSVPSWFHMDEHESKRELLSEAVFKPGSVYACHRLLTEKKPWEFTEMPGVRDLFAAMLFVRSQPLRDGDRIRLAVFPDESPYLVDLTVAGRDMLTILGRKIPAIRFTIRIQNIETHGEHKGALTPDRKFRSGRIWMSDDAERLPLRAEVDIFIGKIFAEIESCHLEGDTLY